MTGAMMPLLSYGDSAGPVATSVTWFVNGDGSELGPPAAFAANFVGTDGEPPEVYLGSFSSNTSFGGASPRSVSYPNGLGVPADSLPVLTITLAGGPTDSDPTSITFGGLPFTLRHLIRPPLSEEDFGQHLTVGMLPMRDGLPGTDTLTVTWAAANGDILIARLLTLFFVSPDSDDFADGFTENTEEAGAGGTFSMTIGSQTNDLVLTGVYSPIPSSTNPPIDFTGAGNAFIGDYPYNAAFRVTPA